MNEGLRRFVPDKFVDTHAADRRAEIDKQIEEYLANGGEIEQLEMGFTNHRIQLTSTNSKNKERRTYIDPSKRAKMK